MNSVQTRGGDYAALDLLNECKGPRPPAPKVIQQRNACCRLQRRASVSRKLLNLPMCSGVKLPVEDVNVGSNRCARELRSSRARERFTRDSDNKLNAGPPAETAASTSVRQCGTAELITAATI